MTLIERLREASKDPWPDQDHRDLFAEAADCAEAMLEALESFVAIDDGDEPLLWSFGMRLDQMRAAIKKVKGE